MQPVLYIPREPLTPLDNTVYQIEEGIKELAKDLSQSEGITEKNLKLKLEGLKKRFDTAKDLSKSYFLLARSYKGVAKDFLIKLANLHKSLHTNTIEEYLAAEKIDTSKLKKTLNSFQVEVVAMFKDIYSLTNTKEQAVVIGKLFSEVTAEQNNSTHRAAI